MTETKTLNDLGSNAGLGCDRLCIDFCNKYEEAQAEIRRLRRIEAAAQNLVKQKGRFHTEQAYNALVGTLWA